MEELKRWKSLLRRQVVDRIMAMDLEDRRAQEIALTNRLEGLPGFESAETVLLYVSAFPEEVDTRAILRRARELGKTLVLPSVDRRSRTLKLFELVDLDHDLVKGFQGIPEPRTGCPIIPADRVDWALVPGLAFDPTAQRLGRGAGHYDRLLPGLRPEVQRWALILDAQWVDNLPVEPHDQPLDGVADWQKIISGRRFFGFNR